MTFVDLPAVTRLLRPIGALALTGAIWLADSTQAQTQSPVVLELYTAQGCASCPPADAMMVELAGREDVIALALHVDYWDYIGWTDTFGHAAHTDRQRRYARRFGAGTIYTPQAVIGGTEVHEGFRTRAIAAAIEAQALRPQMFELELQTAQGNAVEIRARRSANTQEPPLAMAEASRAGAVQMLRGAIQPESLPAAPTLSVETSASSATPPSSLVVQLVSYLPEAQVEIEAGENAGRHARYHNIVRDWQVLGNWDTSQPLRMTVRRMSDLPVVVLLQDPGQGTIRAAARLR